MNSETAKSSRHGNIEWGTKLVLQNMKSQPACGNIVGSTKLVLHNLGTEAAAKSRDGQAEVRAPPKLAKGNVLNNNTLGCKQTGLT